ncbi:MULTISPECIES: Lrp/AsnC family transcriptional regulator [Telluria group]|jgi:Lrp/AsnC family leucine-responsive transcriptional regulator|uniref:Winged helix-turn-helix transcriptional regulator n=2 Tax=Telluria group TaxID=2895353 RepID=A0A6L6QCA4_9BURK|nr:MULTISPECIES: Lrp/AsnC family transcriptional regulator [Telluria group]KQZ25874.1 AsnC family transcriptional regulator [Duganella sp. Root1480D1]MTW09769.1 winged helix-turn-helix transcriptional regulator [Massilia eburnea]MYN04182.1 winged helix-turn-helix transcriptional regulator [Pseudoduganella guangdongensis]SFF68483.1 transcriptional regulator, AsnC family [Duganella sp. CF458]
MTKIALDKTDRKILSILQTDGRLSNQDVAEQVNLSPSPCLRRIKRLEEEGVIRQYVALLDPDKIGLGLLAYVNVRLEKHSDAAAHSNARALGVNPTGTSPRADFAVAVEQWPEVVACYAMTGEMDYLLRVHVEDMDHFSRFMMATLLRHPAVLDVKSSFALQRIKDTTALPLV